MGLHYSDSCRGQYIAEHPWNKNGLMRDYVRPEWAVGPKGKQYFPISAAFEKFVFSAEDRSQDLTCAKQAPRH